jgi:hypothetical protein
LMALVRVGGNGEIRSGLKMFYNYRIYVTKYN